MHIEQDAQGTTDNDGGYSDPFDVDNSADLAEVFGFSDDGDDPKPASKKSEGDGGESSPQPPVGAGEGDGEGQPAGGEPSPDPKPGEPADERDLELESLRAQLKNRDEDAEAARKAAEEAPKPEAKAEEKPKAHPLDEHAPKPTAFKLPKEYAEAMLDEDPDKNIAAIEGIVGGIFDQVQQQNFTLVKAVYDLQQQVKSLTEGGAQPKPTAGATPAADTPATADAAAAREKMQTDYYKLFPAHKNAAYTPVLAAVAQEFATKYPGHAWNDSYINSLGAAVENRVKELTKLTTPGSTSTLQPGTRSAVPGVGGEDNSADDILGALG